MTGLIVCSVGCNEDARGPLAPSDPANVSTSARQTSVQPPRVVFEAAPHVVTPRGFRVKQAKPIIPPASVAEVAGSEPNVEHLAYWARDTKLTQQVRYSSLRKLEQADPDQAVLAAIDLVKDGQSLVRNNAIALLARSHDPRAKAAIRALTPKQQKLAAALARRSK